MKLYQYEKTYLELFLDDHVRAFEGFDELFFVFGNFLDS
jgi:hypothetical protein